MPSTALTPTNPVLIIGAGITGLTLAQGCRSSGIPFKIYEQHSATPERSQGWGLSIHWSLKALERTIGKELTGRLDETNVDPSVGTSEGGFLFLNAKTLEKKYNVKPRTRYLRCGRQKLIDLLKTGLDIQYGKKFDSFKMDGDGVVSRFTDGSEVRGGMLVGADGNNSLVRKALLGDVKLTELPVNLIGAVRRFTPEQAVPVRELNPLLFFGLQPETKTFFFFSIQDTIPDSDGKNSYDALVGISWKFTDPEEDAMPRTSHERVAEMKRRAPGFAEPLLSMIMDIPNDNTTATGLRLADFPCTPWDNRNGVVTLVGDAAHAMTMYRGEGANHGILDAALLVDQLKLVSAGEMGLEEGVRLYEEEMQDRGREAVLKSRQAALDAHDWFAIHDASPLVGGRVPPASALR